jgi:transposase
MHSTNATGLYAGADLHGNNVFLAICDQTGKSVYQKRVKANLLAVNSALDPYWDRIIAMGVESTFNWYWLVDGLRDQGRNIKLGNPAKMEQYESIKHTDDLTDAQWLAEQLRLGIFPECYVYPKEVRPVRDLLRRRQLFVQQRTQSILSFGSLLQRYGINAPTSAQLKAWTADNVRALNVDCFVEQQLNALLSSLQHAHSLAKAIEKSVLEMVGPYNSFQRILQLPGFGPILGMTIALESGEFSRFPSAGDYASYCRAVKSTRTSNQKQKGKNNSKNGNRYLAWAFIEGATHAARHSPRIQSWYERKKRKTLAVKAKKALACKLAKSVWHVMNGEDFDEKMMFG